MSDKRMAQGKRGTGEDKKQLGIRCPGEIYRWLGERSQPRDTDTARAVRALEDLKELEEEAGARLGEIQAAAALGRTSFGRMAARLALEALDARRKAHRK